jgi:hypothetical protein
LKPLVREQHSIFPTGQRRAANGCWLALPRFTPVKSSLTQTKCADFARKIVYNEACCDENHTMKVRY